MRKFYFVCVLLSFILTQSAFADNTRYSDSKSCLMIAKACKSTGVYKGKNFWMNCMKPVILGKSVEGVTVDPSVVKTCRADKIERMKQELAELESVK